MRYQITAMIAEKTQNDMMQAFDLKPDYKWYISPTQMSFNTDKAVDEAFLTNMINKSKEQYDQNKFWIPAISCMGILYSDITVKELSDGKRIIVIPTRNNHE